MDITGEYLIPASVDAVWKGLNDPAVLCRSIPGCTALDQTGDNEFTATVVASVGPVSATFKGKVELADLDPPHAYTLRGRGQGGPAGFAKGEARVTLAQEGEQTRLTYKADVEIGGKLASVGGRLIASVARKNADTFFSNFANALTGKAETPTAGTPSGGQPAVGVARAPVTPPGHIPVIDRIAWLLVGLAVGIGGTLLLR